MQTQRFLLFDTINTVSAPVLDDETMAAVKAACLRYEQLFNRFDEDSGLSRINRAGGKAVDVDPELAGLIQTALAYCEATDGLFDITMGTVSRLWDLKHQVIPDDKAVQDALAHVGWRHVHVQDARVWLDDPETTLDLGGIAKGYIADRVLDILKNHGVEHAIVNLGGNVVVLGGRPDGTPWRVGLRSPVSSNGGLQEQAFAAVSMTDGSAVTSGTYERGFVRDGVRYHHILDPRTGHPSTSDLISATVLSKASIDGDGFSTALVIMGTQAALSFAAEHPDIELVLIDTSGNIVGTPHLMEKYPFALVQQ